MTEHSPHTSGEPNLDPRVSAIANTLGIDAGLLAGVSLTGHDTLRRGITPQIPTEAAREIGISHSIIELIGGSLSGIKSGKPETSWGPAFGDQDVTETVDSGVAELIDAGLRDPDAFKARLIRGGMPEDRVNSLFEQVITAENAQDPPAQS
jgi:hypothetical protein